MSEYRIGRLNGRFVVTWTDDGKRRRYRLDALTAKEAEREAIDIIRRETVSAQGQSVSSLWEAYLMDRKGRPVEKNMRSSGKPICKVFGALRPDQITVAHCRGYAKDRAKLGIKPGSVWTELGHLRTCLSWAAKARLIDRAPHIERPSKPAPKDRYLTRDEVAVLLAADCEPHIKLAILLMLTTAGRVSAVLDLTWDRVDLERGQVNLRRDQIGPRKGRAIVPINNTLRAALLQARQAALSPWVVEWASGPVKSIRRGFMTAVGNAGLRGVTLHTLRHSAAVHMAEAGVPMDEISQYLGHSNVGITASVYARFSPQHLSKAAGALEFGTVRSVK
jgi:integrase